MARGRFGLPECVSEAREAYRERLDTVRAFVAEECSLSPQAWTQRSALYRTYRTWASEGGRLPVSAVTFNDHLRRAHAGRVGKTIHQGNRGWQGIVLRRASE